VNKVFLIGNLTKDPELSTIPNGTPVCKFSIAVNRRFSKGGDNAQEQTDFFNITVWRAVGENCGKYLKKGNKVAICGSIQMRSYEKDGEKKYYTDIIADDVEFLTPKNSGSRQDDAAEMAPLDDSLPF
jgi:single-strand DNA-binding protein